MPNAPKTFRPRHLRRSQRSATRPPDRRGKTTDRGYGWDWQRVRKLALDRDHHLCVPCRQRGRLVPAVDVDHVEPFSDSHDPRRLDLDNLMSLCRPCHNTKTARQ